MVGLVFGNPGIQFPEVVLKGRLLNLVTGHCRPEPVPEGHCLPRWTVHLYGLCQNWLEHPLPRNQLPPQIRVPGPICLEVNILVGVPCEDALQATIHHLVCLSCLGGGWTW